MSIIARVDDLQQRVVVRAVGSIGTAEILAHLQEEEASANLALPELVDARGAKPDISAAEVRTVVNLVRRLAQKTRLGPTAILVDSELAYGMLRMLEILVQDTCAVRPFRQQAQAEEWLNAFGTGKVRRT